MKKGVFISCERKNGEIADSANGILKKVYAQIQALNIQGELSCEHVELPNTRMRYLKNLYKDTLKNEKYFDFLYIRRICPVDKNVISFLKRLRSNNPKCKILYEIPTYPYDKEDNIITSSIDKLYRMHLKKYVDKIVTVSQDDKIFGISTINIVNGILCKDFPLRKEKKESDELHLIAVANFAPYHGYDRLIEGLNLYYRKENNKKVFVHFVGEGSILIKYKTMIQAYCLQEYCYFHGFLSGEKLSEIYDQCDIAVCSLACHRKGVFLSSELKSREYFVRGFPIVTSTKVDIIPNEFEYCLRIPEDDSPVNVSEIIGFYDDILLKKRKDEMSLEIRRFAEENCEITKTMKPVIDYILRSEK